MPKPKVSLTAKRLLWADGWLLHVYFVDSNTPPTSQQIDKILASRALLKQAAEQACLKHAPRTSRTWKMKPRTQEAFNVITEALESAPLDGIHVDNVLALLRDKLDYHLAEFTLRKLISYHRNSHKLRCFRNKICFCVDATMMILAQDLAASKKAQKAVLKPRIARVSPSEKLARETIQLHSRRVA